MPEISEQDLKRYRWLRWNFSTADIDMNGTYRPRFTGNLPRARSLDDAIDQRIMEEFNGNDLLMVEVVE